MNHKEDYLSGGNILLLSIEWNTFDYNHFHSSMNHKEVYLSGGNILYCQSLNYYNFHFSVNHKETNLLDKI